MNDDEPQPPADGDALTGADTVAGAQTEAIDATADSSAAGEGVLRFADRGFLEGLRNARPEWVVKYTWMAVIIVVVVGLAWLVATQVQSLLTILLTALFLSFALEPAVNWLENRGWRRGVATALVFLIFLVLVGVFVPLLVNVLIREGETLSDDIPGWIDDINGFLKSIGVDYRLSSDVITSGISKLSFSSIGSTVVGFVTTAVGILVRVFMILLFTIYLVVDGPRVRRTICGRLRPDRQRRVLDLWEISIDKTGGYFYSRAVVAVAAAVFVYLTMLLASFVPESSPEIRSAAIPAAIFYGLMDAFIPVIGAYIGAFFPILIVLVSGDWVAALIVVVGILVYKQIEDYWISPKVSARTMSVHPAIAIGSVFAGAELMGITGALIALPVAAIIQAFLSTYLQRHELIDSKLVSKGGRIEKSPPTRHRMREWIPTKLRRGEIEDEDDDTTREVEGPTTVLSEREATQTIERQRDTPPDA